MRYHVLKAGVTIRNLAVCLALIAGSYLASGLVNASPVTQPALTGRRTRGVIVTPPAGSDPIAKEIPASGGEKRVVTPGRRIHNL